MNLSSGVIRFNVTLRKIFKKICSDDAGNALVVAVIATSVFIGMTGLAVDYGMAVMKESKLKAATDLAALAGVQELPYQSSAVSTMQNYIAQNYADKELYGDSGFTTNYGTESDICWVTADHEMPTYFMRLFGRDTLTIKARSKAILETVEGFSGGIGIMPFVLVNPNKNTNPHDDLDASNNGQPFVLKYAEDNIMVEDWFYGRQIVDAGVDHYDGSLPDGGWRSPLALDPNSSDPGTEANSADDFRSNFAEGWSGEVEIGDLLDSNPGVMTSGAVQGRKDRLDNNTTSWDGFDPNLDPENSRIVVVPVVSLGSYDASGEWQEATKKDIENGDYEWKQSRVDGFATFFLLSEQEQGSLPGGENIDRKWVVGRFMYGVNIGGEIISSGPSEGPDFGMVHGRLIPFDS